MTESPSSAAGRLFAALAELRQATVAVSYATLVRQAAAQQPPVQISSQRLSDWFGGKAVPADPAVVRFLVEYLQPKVIRTSGYQQRPLSWWLDLYLEVVQQRQANRDDGGHSAAIPRLRRRLGRPVGDCDPLMLEVHPAIHVSGGPIDPLPGYVARDHDVWLREVADQVIGNGLSRLVTVVGGSSTGKTRACWELVQYLEQRQPGRWWVWHPYDPNHPDSALADLDRVGPDTIVWLNEAQFYLAPTHVQMGERLAAGLRSQLQDSRRGPVLVLATVWREYWSTLTDRPDPGQPDPHGQARELLVAGSKFDVPDTFSTAELSEALAQSGDPRLRQAADRAEGGRITQYLAGAPALLDRYRTAPPAARALIEAAMDARRLGHPPAIPHDLLARAAPGYLDDHDWDMLVDDWLEEALAYTAKPAHGIRIPGPLTLIRPRPGDSTTDSGQPCYRLADYLEQTGRHERAGIYPPASLWTTFATTIIDPDLLYLLAWQARHRGRFQHAIRLYTKAAGHGNSSALSELARLRRKVEDRLGAENLVQWNTGHHDANELRALFRERAESRVRASLDFDIGDTHGMYAVFNAGDRAFKLAAWADNRGDADALWALVKPWNVAGDQAELDPNGDADAPWALAKLREEAGDQTGAEDLAVEAAVRGDTYALWALAMLREKAGDQTGAEDLAVKAADRRSTDLLWMLAMLREKAGDQTGAEDLAVKAADRGDTDALRALAKLREKAGDQTGAEDLYFRAVNRGDTAALRALAMLREKAGDQTGADRIRRFGLTGPGEVATKLDFGS